MYVGGFKDTMSVQDGMNDLSNNSHNVHNVALFSFYNPLREISNDLLPILAWWFHQSGWNYLGVGGE